MIVDSAQGGSYVHVVCKFIEHSAGSARKSDITRVDNVDTLTHHHHRVLDYTLMTNFMTNLMTS